MTVTNMELAINAGVAVVAVTTRDPMNFVSVVAHITKKKPTAWNPADDKYLSGKLYYISCDKNTKMSVFNNVYVKMVAVESTLLVVNPPDSHPSFFYAGEVPVPRDMMATFVASFVEDETAAKALLPPLGGCTIKEAVEFLKITMSRDKALTPEGLTLTRKQCFTGARGLFQIDTFQEYYDPPEELLYWIGKEKPLFLNQDTDHRLVPRGLLLDGHPGVGKTAGSKYLARQFGVPLYRVDIGSVQEKWVGSSEANMAAAFSQLDQEEPCVALFDEIEKVYGGSSDASGVSERMLAQMLWWLAEHRSRVLVVMTTNNRKALPPELYRKGRIDDVMVFPGLQKDESVIFCQHVLKTFTGHEKIKPGALSKELNKVFAQNKLPGEIDVPMIAHATATAVCYDLMKGVYK